MKLFQGIYTHSHAEIKTQQKQQKVTLAHQNYVAAQTARSARKGVLEISILVVLITFTLTAHCYA